MTRVFIDRGIASGVHPGVEIHPFAGRKLQRENASPRVLGDDIRNPEVGKVCHCGAEEHDGTCFAIEIGFPVKTFGKLTHHYREVHCRGKGQARLSHHSLLALRHTRSLLASPRQRPLLDQCVDRRNHGQREHRRRNHAAHHRRRDAAHHFRTCPCPPHDRQQAGHDRHDGHHLWPHPFDGAFHDRRVEVVDVCRAPSFTALGLDRFPGVVEVDQHDHAGFGRHPCQRDEADDDGDRQVVVEQPHQPDASDQGEGHREHDDQRFG